MRMLILGLGYVGLRLGKELAQRGHEVFGLRRTPAAHPGIQPIIGDITKPEIFEKLPRDWDWIVNTISSSKGGPEDYQAVYLEGTRNIMAHLRARKYVYTSSTSVYGQMDGSVVDEKSPTEPTSATSRILVETEQLLLSQSRLPAVILRVSGIYGAGRGHLYQQYLRGEALIPGRGERMINMIHVDDVVGATIIALDQAKSGEVYNVTDDEPVSYLEFFKWLSKRLNRPTPPFAEEVSTRKRGITNKHVSNRKLRELGWTLKYPTFREGYEAEIQAATT
jgi:nucleoside-diphosphate-sugar epimerase